jgi:hypothetical protein
VNKLDHALNYARLGFMVFPASGKRPIEAGWQASATTDESAIRAFFERYPDANIAVACGQKSNLTVLDVDGDLGRDTLRELEMEHGELPEGPIVHTGRGGNHYYFRYEASLGNAVRFAPGLDIRTEGGLVIGAGSRTAGDYVWDASFTLADNLKPPRMPEWLIRKVHEAQASKGREHSAPRADAPIGKGERNQRLYELGRSVKASLEHKSLPSIAVGAAVRETLVKTNLALCKPPLAPREVETLVGNVLTQADSAVFAKSETGKNLWAQAVAVGEFLTDQGDDDENFVVERLAMAQGVTLIGGPRGACKTMLIHALAVAAANGGLFLGRPVVRLKVLLIDRDNPRRVLRKRLRAWGAASLIKDGVLKVMYRDQVPPLRDHKAWAQFPVEDYDLVLIDSLGAMTEGVSEQEGGESGQAFAPLLDLARRGPAIIVLTNVRKDGAVIRGSGVVSDRCDLIFEVRDLTGVKFDPRKGAWSECLPEAGAQAWLDSAKRRQKRDRYRLALFCTKCRVGDEPAPFVVEIHVADDSEWSAMDVTDVIEREFGQSQANLERSILDKRASAIDELCNKVRVGAQLGKTEAKEWLRTRGLTDREAREDLEQAIEADRLTMGKDEAADKPGRRKRFLSLVTELDEDSVNGNGKTFSRTGD